MEVAALGRARGVLARGMAGGRSRWVQRQGKDPFVRMRDLRDYRARSAFKLAEMDDKLRLLRPRARVVDLGAAPGGWTQVALERAKGGVVVMSDLLPIEPLEGAKAVQGDFLDEDVQAEVLEAAGGGKVDVVLSDMAPNAMGDARADHMRQIELARAAFEVAQALLTPGGAFLVKVFAGAEEPALARDMRAWFREFKRLKPRSSRSESPELYFWGRGAKSG